MDCLDVIGCEVVLKVYVRNKLLDEMVNLKLIVMRISGFLGVDLENLLNEVVFVVVC